MSEIANDWLTFTCPKNLLFFAYCKISNIFKIVNTFFIHSWPKDRDLLHRLICCFLD